MTFRDRLTGLDERLLPGQLPRPSAASLRRSALLFGSAFVLATAVGVVISVTVDKPDWLGAAVSGGVLGLAGALLLSRLVRQRSE